MSHRSRRIAHLSLLVAALSGGSALAQTVTGAVSGTVTDNTGAVIPNATVTAKNIDTSVATSATTNESGSYSLRYLPIGRYEVTAEAAGFSASKLPSFALEVNQTVKFDAKLSAGAADTTVTVQGDAAPILNTTDATLAYTFTANQLENLPLNGGNFAQVAEFAPGVVATPNGFSGSQSTERNTQFTATPAVAGNRTQENDYTLEGADNNEPQQNLIAYNPAVEALGEVRLVNADSNVTYGNSNGGSIVSVLKSGTDNFHGKAFGYLENYHLDANSWGNKFGSTVIPKNPYNQIRFGGTFGGPILRSKKLFFFGDYYGVRRHSGGEIFDSVLPTAWRTGDFSSLLNPPTVNGAPQYSAIQLYDPQNNFAPYPKNQITVTNPVATYLFSHPNLYPQPNATPTDGLMNNNLIVPQKQFIVNNQFDVKIDWDPGKVNQFSAFYSSGRAYDGASQAIAVTFPGFNVYPTHIGGGSWAHTFSSAIVNQARFGFTRVRWDQGLPTDPSGLFGTNGDAVVGIPFVGAQPYVGFSQQGFGATNIGTTAGVGIVRDNTFKYSDNLTWQRGHHLITIGGDARRYQQNYVNTGNTGNSGFLGNFTYNGKFTSNPNAGADGAVLSNGYAPADFLLDRVYSNGLSSSLGVIGNRQWRFGFYFQDDWKVSEKLTLNLGLRYQYDQPWYEAHNKTSNVIFLNGQATLEYAGAVPANAVPGSVVCPTHACYNATYDQFMPRLGFAYQINSRAVLRGGYAATSFLEGDNFNQRLTSNPPFVSFSATTAIAPVQGNGGVPLAVEQGFNPQFTGIGATTYSEWPQNQKPAYVNQFNLTFEYALTSSTTLSTGYLGETGSHLSSYSYPGQWTIQQANIYSLLSPAIQNDPTQWPSSIVTPYSNLPGNSSNSTGVLMTGSSAMMNYNGLLMSLRQRVSHGLEFTANYTYSKSLANQTSGNYGGAPTNSFNLGQDYGPASTDIRHNVSFNGVYTVPFGRGQLYGANTNRVMDLVLGGWRVGATLINYSGMPVTIGSPHNNLINGVSDRANRYGRFHFKNRSLTHYWGTDASVQDFVTDPTTGNTVNACTLINSSNGVCAYGPESSTPGQLAYGTASSNSERGPGYRQVDSSLFKDFHLYHENVFSVRANIYNLFNIASYSAPDSGVSDGNFGQITGVNSPPRQVEFSARYSF